MSQSQTPSADNEESEQTATSSQQSTSRSAFHNYQWFDEEGAYVPLENREGVCVFNTIFTEMDGVEEFDQIGSYLHIYSDRDPHEVIDELEAEHGNITVKLESPPSNHTYRYIETSMMFVIRFSSK